MMCETLAYLGDRVRVRGLGIEGAVHVLAHLRVRYSSQRVHGDQNSTLRGRWRGGGENGASGGWVDGERGSTK